MYRDFAGERDRLQQERVAAYREYIADIASKSFPTAAHDVSIDTDEFEAFMNKIDESENLQ